MAKIIALDWGTTSFRAYLLNEQGCIEERFEAKAGILNVIDGDFARVLHDQLHRFSWEVKGLPIIASGMITSRQGWLETVYIPCPAAPEQLAANLKSLDVHGCGQIWFVPGVKQLTPQPDIIRGEETQLAGLNQLEQCTVILPGTHAKWVNMKNGIIHSFITFLTGDLYQSLLQHSILKVIPAGKWSEKDYLQGVIEGYSRMRSGLGLLSGLFQVRARMILGADGSMDGRSFLSGLVVGCEIAEGLAAGYADTDTVIVAGDNRLTHLYLQALAQCKIQGTAAPDDIGAAGLFRLARLQQLI